MVRKAHCGSIFFAILNRGFLICFWNQSRRGGDAPTIRPWQQSRREALSFGRSHSGGIAAVSHEMDANARAWTEFLYFQRVKKRPSSNRLGIFCDGGLEMMMKQHGQLAKMEKGRIGIWSLAPPLRKGHR